MLNLKDMVVKGYFSQPKIFKIIFSFLGQKIYIIPWRIFQNLTGLLKALCNANSQYIHEPDLYRTKQDIGQQPSHTQLHVTDGLTMQDKLDNHVVGFCKVLVIELLTSQLQEA